MCFQAWVKTWVETFFSFLETGKKSKKNISTIAIYCTILIFIFKCELGKRVNTPFRQPSCQAREEKRKFSPAATSLRRRRQRSRTWATAQRALAEERKWRPKVHQARRDDRFSSRFLSLLLTAAIVPTRPTPLRLCSPLPLSLSLRPGLMHSKMWLCELYIICYQF